MKLIGSWDDQAKLAVARAARAAASMMDPTNGPVDGLMRWSSLAAAATAAVRNEVAATVSEIGEELQGGRPSTLIASDLPQDGMIADPFLAETSPALRVMRQQSALIVACHKVALAAGQAGVAR